MKKVIVTLTQDERKQLSTIVSKGKSRSQTVVNALILLACDEGKSQDRRSTNQAIANVLNISMRKIDRVKRRFVEDGLETALNGRPSSRQYTRKADGDFEAHLVALSCSQPPKGYARWSLRLLAGQVGALDYIDDVSYETIRRVLKKNELKPWKRLGWVIPPEQNGSFGAHMEMVLDVYKRPYDPKYPVVCMDETPKQLIAETRAPIPVAPGRPAQHDYEYRRCGVCNIFLACEPLAGTRMVTVTERKNKRDWACFLKEIVSH